MLTSSKTCSSQAEGPGEQMAQFQFHSKGLRKTRMSSLSSSLKTDRLEPVGSADIFLGGGVSVLLRRQDKSSRKNLLLL